MSTKKVLFILPELGVGGVEKNTLNFANRLINHNYKIGVVFQRVSNNDFKAKFKSRIQLIQIRNLRLRNQIFEYIKVIRSHNPNIIINSMIFVHFILMIAKYLARSDVKIFLKIETNVEEAIHKRNKPFEKVFFKMFGRRFIRYSDAVICSSKGIFNDFRDKYFFDFPEKLFLNYNPIIEKSDIPKFHSKPDHPFYKENNNILISNGRLTSEKGFLELLAIFSKLVQKFNFRNCKLIIIGEGEDYNKITNFISLNSLENFVDIISFNDDFERFLFFSDTFVCNSIYEGFNNNIVHALNMGIYVVSKDCDFGPREILIDKTYGHLVKSDDELETILLKRLGQKNVFNEYGFRRSLDFLCNKSSDNLEKIINGV